MPLFLKYVLAWFLMMVLAIINGTLREKTYGQRLSELRAHQLSTLIACVLFFALIAYLSATWGYASVQQAWWVGLTWVAMTLVFEFCFGHWVAGHSWQRLFHDYNLFAGRVWLFVPVVVAVSPRICYQIFQTGQ